MFDKMDKLGYNTFVSKIITNSKEDYIVITISRKARSDAKFWSNSGFPVPQKKLDALAELGEAVAHRFNGPLIVDREYVDMEHHGSFHYYYLAEMVKGKIFGFVPATFHRVLVSVDDWDSHSNAGCTVLDPSLKEAATQMNEEFGRLVGKSAKTIEDSRPLLLRPLLFGGYR